MLYETHLLPRGYFHTNWKLYLCHMWIQSMKIAWFIAGIFLVECVGSVYAPSTYLSYMWGEIKELNLELPFFSGPLCILTCAVALCHVTPPVLLLSLVDISGDGWVGDLCTDPMHSARNIPAIMQVIFWKCYGEDTFTTFEIPTWLPDFILGINPFRIFCAWSIWADVTYYLGNNAAISSLSFDRHLSIQISAWLKLGMHTNKAKDDWE